MNEQTAASRAADPFADVYRRERHALVRLGVLFVGSRAVAEELVQDAFLRMHPRFDTDAPDLATHVAGGGFDFAFVSPAASVTSVIVKTGPDYLDGAGIPRPTG